MGNSMKRKLIWSFSLLLFIGSLSVVQGHEGWNDKEEDSVLPSVDSATYVSEGNYLGKLNQGYIEVKKYISIVGGFSSDFSSWDPTRYITSIRPGVEQAGTSGSHGLLDIYVRGNRKGVVLIDGLSFDKGQMNAYCGTFVDGNAKKEAMRVTSATNNRFFMNSADLILPSGGGKWTKVPADQFEDVEQLKEYEGNKELDENEAFIKAIDAAYLKGFASISIKQSQDYQPNSAANQVNRIFGLNQQGMETIRVTMFANRYPFEKAFALFGVVKGFGAQKPEKR